MKKLRSYVQSLIERGFIHGTMARLLLLFVVSSLFILFGTSAMFLGLFDAANQSVESIKFEHGGGFIDALWWSLKHAIDPGAFTEDYGSSLVIVLFALFITIGGWAIFGTFVGLISTSIEQSLNRLEKGIGDVKVSNHILILGWNKRAPAVIHRLHHSFQDPLVVVLSPRDIQEVRTSLRLSGEEGTSSMARKTILRQGVLGHEAELDRVSFREAAQIMILAHEDEERDTMSQDMTTIELVSLLAHMDGWGTKRPQIVAEVQDGLRKDIANLAGDHQVPIVTTSEMISRVLVQCSRKEGLSLVYEALFSSGSSQLKLETVRATQGMKFIDILNKFPGATPIGVCDVLDVGDKLVHIPDLNPPGDHIIEEQEKIILISSKDHVFFDQTQLPFDPLSLSTKQNQDGETVQHIMVLGFNDSLKTIFEHARHYLNDEAARLSVVSLYDPKAAHQMLGGTAKLDHVNFIQADYLDRTVMKDLLSDQVDRVILLSDESRRNKDPDTIVKMALILIQWVFETQSLDKKPHVVGEVLEHSGMLTRPPYSHFDLISSPEIFSLMMTHFARENALRTIATELLNPLGQTVNLRPVDDFGLAGQKMKFGELVRGVKMHSNDIVWGILKGVDKRALINPDRHLEIDLESLDRLIVLGEGSR